jgi:hypothetical protein
MKTPGLAVRQGCLGRQAVKAPKRLTLEKVGRPGQNQDPKRCARAKKKPTKGELPAWLRPKAPHRSWQPPCPGGQVGVGASPTLDVGFIMRRNPPAGQWFVVPFLGHAAEGLGCRSLFLSGRLAARRGRSPGARQGRSEPHQTRCRATMSSRHSSPIPGVSQGISIPSLICRGACLSLRSSAPSAPRTAAAHSLPRTCATTSAARPCAPAPTPRASP